jgi:hypothetical protein
MLENLSQADYDTADWEAIQAMDDGTLMPKTIFEKRTGARYPRPFKLVYPSVVPLLTRKEVKEMNEKRVAEGKLPLSAMRGEFVEIETIYNRIALPSTLSEEGKKDFINFIAFDTEFNVSTIFDLDPSIEAEKETITTKATAVFSSLYSLIDASNTVGELTLDGSIYELNAAWTTSSNSSTVTGMEVFDVSIPSDTFDAITTELLAFKSIYVTSEDETPSDDNLHQHMILNLEKIRDMFIVDAEEGADVYTKDDRTDQSWRMMFSYNQATADLNVHVATKYQIPDNGVITLTERTSTTFKTEIAREPGELADVYLSVNANGFTDSLPIDPTTGMNISTEISTTQRVGGFKTEKHYDKLSASEAVYSPQFNIRASYTVKIDGRTNLVDNKGNRVNWFPYMASSAFANVPVEDNIYMDGSTGYPNYELYRQYISKVYGRAATIGKYDDTCEFAACYTPVSGSAVDHDVTLDGYIKYDDADINKLALYAGDPSGASVAVSKGSLRECRFVLNPGYVGAKPSNDWSNRAWIDIYADRLLETLPKFTLPRIENFEVESVDSWKRISTGGGYDSAVTTTTSVQDGLDQPIPTTVFNGKDLFRFYLKPAEWYDAANPYFDFLPNTDIDQPSNAFNSTVSKTRLTDYLDETKSSKATVAMGSINTLDFTSDVHAARVEQFPVITLPSTNNGAINIATNSTTPNEQYHKRAYKETGDTTLFESAALDYQTATSKDDFINTWADLGDWLKCSRDTGIRFYTWYTNDTSVPNNLATFKRHLEIYLEYKQFAASAIVRDIVASSDALQQFKQIWVDIVFKEFERDIFNPMTDIVDQKESTRLEIGKKKSSFFNRKGQTDKDVVNTYPISYKLTVTGYGVGIHLWDQASLDQDTEFAWLVVQRHVHNQTGKPDLKQKAPLHCMYSPSKRKNTLDELPLYFKAGDILNVNEQLNKVYDASGNEMVSDEQVIVPIVFDSTNVTNLIKLPDTDKLTTYNKQFVKDSISVMLGDSQLTFDANAIVVQRQDRTTYAYTQGAVKWSTRLEEAVDGSVTYSIDTGSGNNTFTYDETSHMVFLKYMPPAGTKLYVSYRIKPMSSNFAEQFTVQKKEDPEFPDRDMNKTKAIYRFVVRERDVLKPWDFHKSATMHQVDSFAVINPLEQLSVTPDRNFVFAVPNGLTTQRFYYPTSEMDIIAYTSAEISAQGSMIEISKYDDNFYADPNNSSATAETAPVRVYEGMMSTLPNGNGMRIFFLSNGGPIRPEWSDVDPAAVVAP